MGGRESVVWGGPQAGLCCEMEEAPLLHMCSAAAPFHPFHFLPPPPFTHHLCMNHLVSDYDTLLLKHFKQASDLLRPPSASDAGRFPGVHHVCTCTHVTGSPEGYTADHPLARPPRRASSQG